MSSEFILRTDGYYRSQPLVYEDFHGGGLIRGLTTQFWRFLPDGLWVGCNRWDHDFQFWQFSQTLDQERIRKAETHTTGLTDAGEELFRVGVYNIENGVLTAEHAWHIPVHPAGEMVLRWSSRWEIAEGRLLPRTPPVTEGDPSVELEFFACP